jgi:epoxyqueuosine reductase QueG
LTTGSVEPRTRERDLYPIWASAVARIRRFSPDSIVALEFPHHSRRVDVALLTKGGDLHAYEFKRNDVGRAIRQAAANSLSFDRSYVVVPNQPTIRTLNLAQQAGVGVMVVSESGLAIRASAPLGKVPGAVKQRTKTRLQARGIRWADHVWSAI